MKLLLLIIFFIVLPPFNEPDYTSIFTFDYTNAIHFVEKNKNEIDRICAQYNCDLQIITSVFFPELIRYSLMHNYFETKALEIIYVRKGSEYADFSIGRLQMKPSFVEQLEKEISAQKTLFKKYNELLRYKSRTDRSIRRERIERLTSFEWQLKYMSAFYDYMEITYEKKQFTNIQEKIKFYATAYNHGFTRPEQQIINWMDKAIFPYGLNSDARQYPYSDVSVYFFETNYHAIFAR